MRGTFAEMPKPGWRGRSEFPQLHRCAPGNHLRNVETDALDLIEGLDLGARDGRIVEDATGLLLGGSTYDRIDQRAGHVNLTGGCFSVVVRLTWAITMPPLLWAATAVSRVPSTAASSSKVRLPYGSAVVARMIAASTGMART